MIKKFISIHVIKAAGNSFGKALERIYKGKFLWDRTYSNDKTSIGVIELTDKSQKVYPKDYSNYDIIHGHFTIDKYKHLKLPMMIFLREPVSRVISHYSYSIYRCELNKWDIKKHVPDFEEFCFRTSNLMFKMIGEDLNKFFFIGIVENYEESMNRVNKILNKDIKILKKNETKTTIDISTDMISIIKKYNEKDLELYKNALERFNNGLR